MTSGEKLLFKCYECEKEFTRFEYLRSHELFIHGHVVENCKVDYKNLIEKKIQEQKDKRKKYRRSEHYKAIKRKSNQKNYESILRKNREYYQKNKEKIQKKRKEGSGLRKRLV